MMFKKLAEMMKVGDTLAISASMQGDGQMTLTIHAVGSFKQKALAAPLSMTATPEELDAGMAEELGRWVGARKSLREQVDAANVILEVARRETAQAASKATQKPGKAVKTAAPATAAGESAVGDDDEAHEAGGEGGAGASAGKPEGGEVSGEQAAINLFSA